MNTLPGLCPRNELPIVSFRSTLLTPDMMKTVSKKIATMERRLRKARRRRERQKRKQ